VNLAELGSERERDLFVRRNGFLRYSWARMSGPVAWLHVKKD